MNKKYMLKALELAKLGEGKVDPNPLVGAVLVKNEKIIGEGWHKKYGEAHAEINALNSAIENPEGATLYVTLEPCSHYGKTPPCVKKIIESKIKKCVIACLDPNPLISGKGIELLKNAGIEIEVGLLEKEAKELNRVFFKYIEEKIPYLFLKCAITLDGKLATRSGNSKWITNSLAREKVQKLRNKYMGIMVGINTVLKDDPSLDARIENGRNPFRIIVDPNLEIFLEAKVLNFKDNKVIVITSSKNKKEKNFKLKELEKLGVKIEFLSEKKFKIKDILRTLSKYNISSVLLEGGGKLISSAFEENIIDGGEIFIAPKIIGDNRAVAFVDGFKFENINEIFQLKNIQFNNYGDNISVEFYK